MNEQSHAVVRVIEDHVEVAKALRALAPQIALAGFLVLTALARGGKLLVAGNGGSAADAQHIAAELAGRFMRERRPLAAIALNGNSSAITAIGNDYGFEEVFARQVGGLGRAGDVLLAISTSGSSPNILRAVDEARALGMTVIGLTGERCGLLVPGCDLALKVPSEVTARIQEMHILIGHLICQIVEEGLTEASQGLSAAPIP